MHLINLSIFLLIF